MVFQVAASATSHFLPLPEEIAAASGRVGGKKSSTQNGQKWVIVVVRKGVLGGRYITDARWVKSGWPEASPKSRLCQTREGVWIPPVSLRPTASVTVDTPLGLALKDQRRGWEGTRGCLAMGNKRRIVPPKLLFGRYQ